MNPANRNSPRKVPYQKLPTHFAEQVDRLERRGLIQSDRSRSRVGTDTGARQFGNSNKGQTTINLIY